MATVDSLEIEFSTSSNEAVQSINQLSDSMRRVNVNVRQTAQSVSFFSKVLSSLKRIAFYRMIRTAIKSVTDALSEGVKNAYQFSKAFESHVSGVKTIAEAYDSLSSASFKMGNQFGAAWASLVRALEPIIIRIIDLITRAANAITQFFAILGGKGTYLKAIDYSKEWGDSTAAGAKAAKEWKNQLMGFDVINRLEEPSSGGGGGGSDLPDFGSMFEEVEITEKMRDVLEDILGAVTLIGAAFAGWKITNFLKSLSETHPILQKIIGAALAVGGAIIYVQGFMDAWKNGPNWKNLIQMVGGVVGVVTGLLVLLGPVAAGIGAIVGGVGMLILGFREWIKTGEMSTQTFWLLEAGILAVGLGLSMLFGPIGLIVAAVGTAALVIAKNWDAIRESFEETWEKIKEAWNNIKLWFEEKWNKFKEWWGGLSLPSFKIKTPHISWTTEPATGWISNVLSALGIPTDLPRLRVNWYAKGGIVDGATLIGAGEAGAEAIVPLERNTQWINRIASEMNRQNRNYNESDGEMIVAALYDAAGMIVREMQNNKGNSGMSFERFAKELTRWQGDVARANGY